MEDGRWQMDVGEQGHPGLDPGSRQMAGKILEAPNGPVTHYRAITTARKVVPKGGPFTAC
jgi:hypothetical protein